MHVASTVVSLRGMKRLRRWFEPQHDSAVEGHSAIATATELIFPKTSP